MLQLILPIVIAQLKAPEESMPAWVSDLLSQERRPASRPRASRTIDLLVVSDETVGRSIPKQDGRATPPTALDEGGDLEALARRNAESLLRNGRYEDAYRTVLLARLENDIVAGGDPLVATTLYSGRYAQAESLLAAHIDRDGGSQGDYLVELSIASAMQGKVYPGQGAYVVDRLRKAFADTGSKEVPYGRSALPATPKEVALASVLAAAFQSGSPYSTAYLEWAIRLDPKNEIASRRLIDEYEWSRQDDRAIRLAATMVEALPPGPSRDAFALRLRRLQVVSATKG